MKVLTICAHPNPKSFNHAIMEAFTGGLKEGGHSSGVVDLYDMEFNPCMSGTDLAGIFSGNVPADIQEQQEKVAEAEGICIIHPIWWTGSPAILKGYFDRIFSMGFAYTHDKNTGSPMGLLKNEKALIINTSGAAKEDAERSGMTDAVKRTEIDGILGFCGVKDLQHVMFYGVIKTDDATRKGYLEEARNLGKNF